jgi:hypothetical protein
VGGGAGRGNTSWAVEQSIRPEGRRRRQRRGRRMRRSAFISYYSLFIGIIIGSSLFFKIRSLSCPNSWHPKISSFFLKKKKKKRKTAALALLIVGLLHGFDC